MPAALKTIVRPPLAKILRYGDHNLKIVPTCTVHEVEPRERYGRDTGQESEYAPSLSAEMQNLVNLILDAIQELPVFRWAESQMAESAAAGDATMAVQDQPGGTTPLPAAAKAEEQERDPAKVLKQQAAPTPPPAKPQLPPPPQPVRHQKPIIDNVTRTRYARCLADAHDERLDYSKRQSSLAEAHAIREQTADASKAIVERAIKRATVMGMSYEAALMMESGGQELSLPLSPAWVA